MNPIRTIFAVFALSLTLAYPAAAFAEGSTGTSEPLQTYEQQLNSGEITAARFNHYDRRMVLTLKNGDTVFVHYQAHADPKLESELKAHHVSVAVLSSAEAKKESESVKGSSGHTLRYIVVGAVIVVALLAIGVYFSTRGRRERE